MHEADGHAPQYPEELRELVVAQWTNDLAVSELGLTGWGFSGSSREYSREQDGGFRVTGNPKGADYSVDAWGNVDQAVAEDLVRRAVLAADQQELSGEVCYMAGFRSPEPDIADFELQFMRNLGDQIFITGWRRLSGSVLLDFRPSTPALEKPLFVPATEVRVFVFAPGRSPGPLAARIAADVAAFARVICSFALGRRMQGPVVALPAEPNELDEARKKRADLALGTLARDGISLDPFAELLARGDVDAVMKYRNSLVAYDAAIAQSNADVATILFISGIEALISPAAEWRKTRLTARFVRAVRDLAPETVAQLLQHNNMPKAFDFAPNGSQPNQVRKLLERIYELRSAPVHAGPSLAVASVFGDMEANGSMRVSLLSDLYRAVLLAYLEAPRSWLIGHPAISPGAA